MKNKIIYCLCAALITGASVMHSPIVSADNKTQKKIKFRQSGYMFMRWNMGEIKKQVIKNPDSYNKKQVMAAANVIDAIANSGIEKLFTPDTKEGKGWKKTAVKSGFFDNTDDINEIMNKLQKNTYQLVTAANTGDINAIQTQFENTLVVCKSCHKKYRKKI